MHILHFDYHEFTVIFIGNFSLDINSRKNLRYLLQNKGVAYNLYR